MIIFPAPGLQQYSDTIILIEDLLFGLEIDGVKWIFGDFNGWTLGGEVETSDTPRPGAHGMIPGPVLRRGRPITLSGTCEADSAELAEQANDALCALLEDGSTGTFTVQNSRRTLSRRVHLGDAPLDDWISDVAFTWSLQFSAPDRRKYGPEQSADTPLPGGGTGLAYNLTYPLDYGDPGVTGRVQFTNTGKATTEPVFTVTPPLLSGFEITRLETAQRLRYEHPVGSTLTVDCGAGTVLEAGQRRERYLKVREWFSVGPGETATFQFSTLGPETVDDPAHLYLSASPAYP